MQTSVTRMSYVFAINPQSNYHGIYNDLLCYGIAEHHSSYLKGFEISNTSSMEIYMIVGIFLALVLVLLHLIRTYLSGAKCLLRQRLDGKVIVVTGCNTGIGLETVAELARRGARVIMACRDLHKAEQSRAEILERYGVTNNQATKTNVASESLESSLKPITKDQVSSIRFDPFVWQVCSQFTMTDDLIVI